jgi:hypothetical protein
LLYRFGPYEVDTSRKELRKFGLRIRLEAKPWRLLVTLLQRPGNLVTRSELQGALSRLLVGAGWQTLPVWQASLINRDARITSAVTVVGIAVAVLASVAITFWASRLRGEAAAGANEGR